MSYAHLCEKFNLGQEELTTQELDSLIHDTQVIIEYAHIVDSDRIDLDTLQTRLNALIRARSNTK